MRRWNGWGDENVVYPLPTSALIYLHQIIGAGENYLDKNIEEVLLNVPASRLKQTSKISIESIDRLLHARGQSLPDWVALHSGSIGTYPDGVAFPTCREEIRDLIAFAYKSGTQLIPYGAGTSVVGHINPQTSDAPNLTIDMSRMHQLLEIDPINHLATFQTGVRGPDLEDQLNRQKFTLGHYPQSFEYSTLGGWIATRSVGQQSHYYGRIEDTFIGGHVETPIGALDLPIFPASAAGPDIKELFLGSEGRLGIITDATVRIRSIPEVEVFSGIFFRNWTAGISALKDLAQEKTNISMLRLSDAQETETTLILSGKEKLVEWSNRALAFLKYSDEKCLLIVGITGKQRPVRQSIIRINQIARDHGGFPVGAIIGKMWKKSRFFTPYLRNTLWEKGYALDTIETSLKWSGIQSAAESIKQIISGSLESSGEKVLVFAHLSHVYRDGASLYITFLFRRSSDPDESLKNWQIIKSSASQEIIKQKGTISHQHGIGIDHEPYLSIEKGKVGMRLLAGITKTCDPSGLMNPGKLILNNYYGKEGNSHVE